MKKITSLTLFLIIGVFVYAQMPIANAGSDTLFCGLSGYLNATPSNGTGVWTCNAETVNILNPNSPNTEVISFVCNTGNPTNPYFEIVWTETNSEDSDSDTIKIIFARIPNSNIDFVPSKCFGEPATIAAREDSLPRYIWNFSGGICDDTLPANIEGGYCQHFVYWNDQNPSHIVSLIGMNSYGCQSPITFDTIYEPPIPEFDYITNSDTCNQGVGEIIFEDTLGFTTYYWVNGDWNGDPLMPVTSIHNLNSDTYSILTNYLTLNFNHYDYYDAIFGNAFCSNTLSISVPDFVNITANISVSMDINLAELIADPAYVIFVNNTSSDFGNTISILDFGDGSTLQNNDPLVEHIYTEAGCFSPSIISFIQDMPECADTAYIDPCIFIDERDNNDGESINLAYPNPSNDSFAIELGVLNAVNLEIYNSKGNIVMQIDNYNGEMISAENLGPGIYIATYYDGTELIHVRVVMC